MLTGDKRIFTSEKKLNQMLMLRGLGFSYPQLARKYEVDHSTIIHQCQKAGIALSKKKKASLLKMIKDGEKVEEISKKLDILPYIIKQYNIARRKMGDAAFFNKKKEIRIVPRISKKVIKESNIQSKERADRAIALRREAAKAKTLKNEEPVKKIHEAKKGEIWITNNLGQRMLFGKTEEAIRLEAEEKKRRELELKRIKMLQY